MRKQFSVVVLLLFLLSACAQTPAAPASSVPVSGTPTIRIIMPTPASCTSVVTVPTPGPEEPSVFPKVSEQDHVRGTQDPVFTIMDYIDFRDPRSALFAAAADQLLKENPDKVRMVERTFPLIGVSDTSAIAAQAAEAAAEQGKYWELRDLLYQQQASWIALSAGDFEKWIGTQAASLGLDQKKFKADLKREDIVARVQKAWEDGQKMGLPGTPLIVLNGQIYGGPRDYNSLNDIMQLIALGKRQFTACPPVTVERNRQYMATLHTEKGDVVIQLFADKAPYTVNSFLFLVKNGWYDNIIFHRVVPKLFAQTGDPSGTGKGNPGYYVVTEIDPKLKFDRPGMVGMVNSGPDTSGSQFFITYAPADQFDGKYTIFGQVISGMDVLEQLTPRDAQPGQPTPPGDKLQSITIEEK
jgi:cyclophilin family peptidyl-prolyl cis-trans isomerase/protein-disulfide isomerase